MNNTKEEQLIERYIIREYARILGILIPLAEVGVIETVLMKRLSEEMQALKVKVTRRIEIGITRAWNASNKATFALMDKKFANVELPENIAKIIYDPNKSALEAFINSKKGGLNLSERVWEQSKEARRIIKKGLKEGIDEGKPSKEIAKDIKSDLKHPEIKPPKGLYKSPIANAMRVARTEVNAAYRTADQENWNKNPIVIGWRVTVSKTKNPKVKARCELCVMMQGDYPNDFKWANWHPNCLCLKTPILMPREQLNEYNKLIARGEDTKKSVQELRVKAGLITELPDQLIEYVKGGGGLKTWWYSDNKKFFDKL